MLSSECFYSVKEVLVPVQVLFFESRLGGLTKEEKNSHLIIIKQIHA